MNAKTIISILLFSVIGSHLWAQYRISGYVKDRSTGESLFGASVYIEDLKTGTVTCEKGYYTFQDIKAGTYLIDVSFLGYKSGVKKVHVTKDTLINFELTPSAVEMNEVIITGVSRSTRLEVSPVVAQAIKAKDLTVNPSTNLIDALKIVPGVDQITTGPAISKPVIRGLGYNRIITLNNGLRQEDQQWGDEHGIQIDEFSVGRVEIIKGPGSLMYGSDGIAGVLNFLPPKMPPAGKTQTLFLSGYQTNNRLVGTSFYHAENRDGFQWSGRISGKMAGDYQNPYDGKVYNSGFKEWDGSLFGGIVKNWGYSHLTVSSFNQIINMVEGERDSLGRFIYVNTNGQEVPATGADYPGYKTGFPHQEINHLNIASNNHIILDKGVIHFDLGFQNNRRKEFGDPQNPDEATLYLILNTFNYNLKYNLNKTGGWETSLGIGGMQQTNTNRGEEFLIPAYRLFDAGLFAVTQKTFGKVTVSGGLRVDNRHIRSKALYLDANGNPVDHPGNNIEQKFAAFNKNFPGLSGSIGVSWQIDDQSTLKCNFSRGFRAPNIAELASNGVHEGTFRYEIGNPDLKPETSRQIDVAYALHTRHVSLSVTPFVNFIQNYIYSQKLTGVHGDSIPDPSDPVPAFKFTEGNARLSGGEIYLDVHPHPLDWLHVENGFAFVRAVQLHQPDSMKYLPRIPAPKYRGEIKAQFKRTGRLLSNAFVRFGVEHYFPQNHVYSAYGTETPTPAYTLIHAGIGADIKAFNRKDFISLYITGENLTNVAYQHHLSRLKYAPVNPATGRRGVFNPGRNISFKVVIRF